MAEGERRAGFKEERGGGKEKKIKRKKDGEGE